MFSHMPAYKRSVLRMLREQDPRIRSDKDAALYVGQHDEPPSEADEEEAAGYDGWGADVS